MRWGRVLMGGLYVVAGLLHFALTSIYARMIPGYFPLGWHHELVLFSGAAEIAGGLGLLIPGRRRAAAWGLVWLLIAVWPANLWMAQHPGLTPGVPDWLLWMRLPLQLPLIWWAWLYTRPDVVTSVH